MLSTSTLTSHPIAILHFGAIVPIVFADVEKIRKKGVLFKMNKEMKTSTKINYAFNQCTLSSIGKHASFASL